MIGFRPPKDLYPEDEKPSSPPPRSPEEADPELYPFARAPFTRKERFGFVLVALKAALLIGAAFIVGLGLLIFFLTRIWS